MDPSTTLIDIAMCAHTLFDLEQGRKWPIRTIDDMGHQQEELAVAHPAIELCCLPFEPTNTHTNLSALPRPGVRVQLDAAAPLWAPPNSPESAMCRLRRVLLRARAERRRRRVPLFPRHWTTRWLCIADRPRAKQSRRGCAATAPWSLWYWRKCSVRGPPRREPHPGQPEHR